MSTFRQVLKQAQKELVKANGSEQSALLLMLELSNGEAHDLYSHYEDEMPIELETAYNTAFERLLKGEPLRHILGYQWFYGHRIKVNEHVLIPREETEELVANILIGYDQYFSMNENVTLCDIGTGSGAIAIALKKEEPGLNIIATDISIDAVSVAKSNAIDNKAEVCFCVGDMLEPLIERQLKVDILVSNPPYIPQEENIDDSVKDYEPHVALFGGEDGLKFYKIIFERSKEILNERCMLAFEIGYDQKEALCKEASLHFPHAKIEVLKDMNGKDRMLFIYCIGE